MPTDKDIAQTYNNLSSKQQLESSIKKWGDAISWNELHHSNEYITYWD